MPVVEHVGKRHIVLGYVLTQRHQKRWLWADPEAYWWKRPCWWTTVYNTALHRLNILQRIRQCQSRWFLLWNVVLVDLPVATTNSSTYPWGPRCSMCFWYRYLHPKWPTDANNHQIIIPWLLFCNLWLVASDPIKKCQFWRIQIAWYSSNISQNQTLNNKHVQTMCQFDTFQCSTWNGMIVHQQTITGVDLKMIGAPHNVGPRPSASKDDLAFPSVLERTEI